MKTLPATFRSDGFEFQQLAREMVFMHENRGRRPKGGTASFASVNCLPGRSKTYGPRRENELVFWGRGWLRAFLSIRLPIRPPLLSIRPPVLPVFDAGLVADAGGEKGASRRGYQSEQERACDPLSGNRGDGVFHTI